MSPSETTFLLDPSVMYGLSWWVAVPLSMLGLSLLAGLGFSTKPW